MRNGSYNAIIRLAVIICSSVRLGASVVAVDRLAFQVLTFLFALTSELGGCSVVVLDLRCCQDAIFDQAVLFCPDHLRVCAERPFGDSLALVESGVPSAPCCHWLWREFRKSDLEAIMKVAHFVLIVILCGKMTAPPLTYKHLEGMAWNPQLSYGNRV